MRTDSLTIDIALDMLDIEMFVEMALVVSGKQTTDDPSTTMMNIGGIIINIEWKNMVTELKEGRR